MPRATVRGLATAAKGKYPTPPVAASVGLQFEDDAMDPRIKYVFFVCFLYSFSTLSPSASSSFLFTLPFLLSRCALYLTTSLIHFFSPNLPYEIDESEGVSVLKFKEGKFQGEEVVLAHMSATLEWVLPSPPPLHTFDESPIVKEHPDEFTDVY